MTKKDRNPDDDYIVPVGMTGVKGVRLQDIPLRNLDSLLAWLEDKGTRPDVQKVLARYLKDNKYYD